MKLCYLVPPDEDYIKLRAIAKRYGLDKLPAIVICTNGVDDVRSVCRENFSGFLYSPDVILVFSDYCREVLDRTHGHSETSPMESAGRLIIDLIGSLTFDKKFGSVLGFTKRVTLSNGDSLYERIKFYYSQRYVHKHRQEYERVFGN